MTVSKELRTLATKLREEADKLEITTERCNRVEAEKAIVALYELRGREFPKNIQWFDSISAAEKYIIQELKEKPDEFTSLGNFEAKVAAYYKFFLQGGFDLAEDVVKSMTVLVDVIEQCGFVWLFEDAAVLSDRVVELHYVDGDERRDFELHNEEGPAFRFPDGYSGYFINGVSVPEVVVERPEEITIEQIKGAENAEVKRIMRERFGEGEYLIKTGAKRIDVDTLSVSQVDFTEERAVPRMLVEDEDKNRFLVGTDGSTGRVYYMRVPRDVKTCAEAHNALAGFDESRIVSQS